MPQIDRNAQINDQTASANNPIIVKREERRESTTKQTTRQTKRKIERVGPERLSNEEDRAEER